MMDVVTFSWMGTLNFSSFSTFLRSPFTLPENRWIYFSLFLVANCLLAYGRFTLEVFLWIFFLGLLLPLAAAFSTKLRPPSTPLVQKEFFHYIPPWFWLAIYGTAFLSRIAQMTLWAPWPVSDSSMGAHYAVGLSEKWFWHFFFGDAQNPAVFYWGLAVFYKIFTPSLFSTLLYSVLIAILIVGITYWAARSFFSKSMAVFCLMASATGFWTLYTESFSFIHILALLWQIAGLGFLGRLANSTSEKDRRKNSVMLGAILGSGFFVGIAWPVAVVGIFLALLGLWIYRTARGQSSLLPFGFSFLIWVALFLGAALHEHYGQHFQNLWVLRPDIEWSRQWPETVSNFTALFWCNLTEAYGPVFGGMLNPLMASLFFGGLVEFKNIKSSWFLKWVLTGLLVGMAPGFLSGSFDIFRLLHSYPFQIIVCGLGFQRLLEILPARRAILFSLLLFGVSTTLDLWQVKQLAGEGSSNSRNLSKAYEILQKNYATTAPGFILTDLMPMTGDHSLDLAVFPFNAAVNPRISPSAARWVALVESGDYVPFLSQRFTDIHWYDLGEGAIWKKGRLVLGVIPLRPENQSLFLSWRETDLRFRAAVLEYLNHRPFETPEELVQRFRKPPQEMESDPFLESCRYEKILSSMPFQDPPLLRSIVHQALERGYALPFFLNLEERLGNPQARGQTRKKTE